MRAARRNAFAFVVAGVVLLWPALLNAHTIHVLIIADTNDGRVGDGVRVDMEQLKQVFETLVPRQHLNLRTLSGGQVSRDGILDKICSFRANSKDGMVVFWSGHGAYDRKGHFLAMPNGDRLYRAEVVEAIRDCKAGTDVLLTSSCNRFCPLPGEPLALAAAPADRIAPLFEALFLNAKGLVDVNGASEGEYGFATSNTGTSFFRPMFFYFLTNAERSMNWHTFMREIRVEVQRDFQQNYKGQPFAEGQTSLSPRVWHLAPGWPPHTQYAGCKKRGGGSRHRFGVQLSNHRGPGVLVARVFRGSPADRAQVDPGDMILSINGVDVSTVNEMLNAVANSPRVMQFRLKGGRTGKIFDLKATLSN